ncbi:MAG: EAL domain-containing protein [Campylobacterota bacterium]
MSLSKQLYIIIAFIFFMIFAGNFIISVNNTKEYLETESITKAQDTATSLGMTLKPLLQDGNIAEVRGVINAIANRGFYKEIRVENTIFEIKQAQLLNASSDIHTQNWTITNIDVANDLGTIEKQTTDLELSQQLDSLNEEFTENTQNLLYEDTATYIFKPNKNFKENDSVSFNFTVENEKNQVIDTFANLNINKIIAKVHRKEKFDYVPSWFIKLVTINLQEQKSEISSGWETTATVYVSANAGEAYAKLYEQAKGAVLYAFVAFLISMMILFVFVQYILKPLKKIEKLANTISSGKFDTIKKLPWTTEIRSVAISMNDMSVKIESVINKLNKNLENITNRLSKDELTGLQQKQSFETDIKNMFINKDTGYIFVINIFDLANFAKTHTNQEINEFIKDFVRTLKSVKLENKNTQIYRFFGSKFACIAKKFNYDDAIKYTKLLKKELDGLAVKYNKKDIAHIGATGFNQIGTIPNMLQAASEAYEKATLIGSNESFIRDNDDLARDMESWRDLVFDIIQNSNFEVKYINDARNLHTNESNIIMQEAFAKAVDKDKNDIPIGTFVSIAERYDKITQFDKKVIKKVIEHILINSIKHEISINLSPESINDTGFISWIEETLTKYKEISSLLVFSITAYAAAKDVQKLKFFTDEIHKFGAKVIIKRFETKFIPLDNIKDFNLDYIRLARSYTTNISNEKSKQSFVESISELSSLLNIKVFAENVQDEEDLETLKQFNILGASR